MTRLVLPIVHENTILESDVPQTCRLARDKDLIPE